MQYMVPVCLCMRERQWIVEAIIAVKRKETYAGWDKCATDDIETNSFEAKLVLEQIFIAKRDQE